MRGKCLLLIGLGVGYYFGAKAGRSRYRQIRTVANKVWTSKPVQNAAQQTEDFVRGIAPELVERFERGTRFVSQAVSGKGSQSSSDVVEANRQVQTSAPRTAATSTTSKRSTSAGTSSKKSGTSTKSKPKGA